jgi:carbon monoxide dehydrogenase subunit G
MDLAHTFTVPTPVEETWAHFGDIASVAECFPGAQVSSAEGDSFAGSVKVKLGPIALVYNGTGTFVEKDDAAHRFVVDAKGKDKRGNGTAGAKVTLSMEPSPAGGTHVEVLTDLAVTGKPAQFGRGVMQDVSDKLLGQFVACLEQRLAGDSAAAPAAPAAAPATPVDDSGTGEDVAIVRDDSVHTNAVPTTETSRTVPPVAEPVAAEPVSVPPPRHAAAPASPPAKTDDAINLGSTVLPILLKSYWKQGLAAIVVIAVIIIVIIAL